jgi:acyl-coenzyme A synthetase/AMP-(fatty) acid ligase
VDNAVDALVERHRRLGRGAAPAVIDDRGAWSFDDLSEASARAAGALRSSGVGRGDRVAVAMPDGREAVAALMGALRIGAIAVPIDAAAPAGRRRAVLDDCRPVAVLRSRPDGPPADLAPVTQGDPCLLIYTSGTTGRPKGVVHTHRAFATGGPSFVRDVAAAGPGDRCHAAARTATALGFFIGLARPLGAGAAAVLSAGQASGRRALASAERHRATVLAAVPAVWLQVEAILSRRREEAARLSSVRVAVSSGDRLPPGLPGRLAGLGAPPLVDGLGSSECADIVLAAPPGEEGFRRVTPGLDALVADRAGAPVPDGAAGLLWVRSPAAATGYWMRPAESRRLRAGPWLRTEDAMARRGEALEHLGRADELFKVDGRLVCPAEIERALVQDPRVAEAAVVGAPRPGGRLRAAAFVVPATGIAPGPGLARDLRRCAARRLDPGLAPARVVLTDALPRHASGKLDRRRLLPAA